MATAKTLHTGFRCKSPFRGFAVAPKIVFSAPYLVFLCFAVEEGFAEIFGTPKSSCGMELKSQIMVSETDLGSQNR